MAKDWGLEWRLVPPKGRESCRWQSVDNAWVSLTLGHQGDITRIVVASSDGRNEVVEGYEEALNVARRWRSGWVSRRSGPPLAEEAPPSFPTLPPLQTQHQKSRASRSGRSLSNPGFAAPSFGSGPAASSHSSQRPDSDSSRRDSSSPSPPPVSDSGGDTSGRHRQAIPPRLYSRATRPPLLPPLEPEPPTQIIASEPTVTVPIQERHAEREARSAAAMAPTRITSPSPLQPLPGGGRASPVPAPRSPGSAPAPSPRSSPPSSSHPPRTSSPLSPPSPRSSPPSPSPPSPPEDPGPTTSRSPAPRRRF